MPEREHGTVGRRQGVIDRGESEHVELSIPAQPVALQLVRLTAGVVATRAAFDLNDVEDLRLAADELCLTLMGPTGSAGRLLLRYQWDAEMIEISCTFRPDGQAASGESGDDLGHGSPPGGPRGQAELVRRELSAQILDALVDEHGETLGAGQARAWLRMRRIRSGS